MCNNVLVENKLKELGATLVGFADLSEIDTDARKGYRYGVSIAIALNPSIVSEIPTGPHLEYYHEMENVSKKLKELSEFTEKFIIANGYDAFSQASIKQSEGYRTPLPHKTIATRAGLGWIGKSATLVTEKYGNAIRINSVLTDMPFKTGTPINHSKCGNCHECVDRCPGKAVQGVNWDVNTERDSLLNAFSCKAEVIRRGVPFGLTHGTCGMCIAVCRYTQRYIRNNQ